MPVHQFASLLYYYKHKWIGKFVRTITHNTVLKNVILKTDIFFFTYTVQDSELQQTCVQVNKLSVELNYIAFFNYTTKYIVNPQTLILKIQKTKQIQY